MRKLIIYIVLLLTFVSCQKEDEALILPPPGDLTYVVADIGTDYSKAVYIGLENNLQQSRNWKDWDIAFEASEGGAYVYLNTGKFMFACHTNASDFSSADSTGREWKMDNDFLDDDSNAVGAWWLNANSSDVMVVDRGRVFYLGALASQRFKKFKIEEVNSTQYRITFCDYSSTVPTSFIINKNPDKSLIHFSFDDGGKIVDFEPAKNDWDFVLTRYTHIYYGEPVNSIYRFYLVNGGLNNKWNGVTGYRMVKDSTPDYIPFADITAAQAANLNFSSDANTIGFEWKSIDINTGIYSIVPDTYYLIKNKDGFVYKIRFIDFYDDNGNRGSASFEYQRL